MKYITFLFIAMLTFSSCTDFLDKEPDDMLTLEKVFNNRQAFCNLFKCPEYVYQLPSGRTSER